MPLIADPNAASQTAVAEASADAAVHTQTTTTATVTESIDVGASVLDPAPAAEAVLQTQAAASDQAVATAPAAGAPTTTRSMGQAAQAMADAGFDVGETDYTSFPNVVLKDGEFQISGINRVFDAKKGFDGIITRSKRKHAMRVGNDDDAEVVFADNVAAFNDPATEAGKKVQEWRNQGLQPELKEYTEAYVLVTAIHDEEHDMSDLLGSLVIAQISPQSRGRFAGYTQTQYQKGNGLPDCYTTHFHRGEKVTSAKFPFYPWDFRYVRQN